MKAETPAEAIESGLRALYRAGYATTDLPRKVEKRSIRATLSRLPALTAGRTTILPFDSISNIGPGLIRIRETWQEIPSYPQVPFQGRRLLLPPDVARDFLIEDIRVGTRSMLPCAGPIDGQIFSIANRPEAHTKMLQNFFDERGFDDIGRIDFKPAVPGVAIILVVSNRSERPARFLAGVIGEFLEPAGPKIPDARFYGVVR